jgi:putative NIF3 family GTP cyclohydrolase 1 type 2
VGLLVGDQEAIATAVLVCHDALENVIEGNIAKTAIGSLFSSHLVFWIKKK